MRNPLRIIALFAIAGCATTSDPNDRNVTPERVIVGRDGYQVADVTITRDDYVHGGRVQAPIETVWANLPAAFEAVGLPVPAADPSSWTMAVQDHGVMRTIGGERMSKMIDCGRGMTGDHANSHRIRISVRTWLERAGDATIVNTRVDATATSVEGRSGSIACTSRGDLESRIAAALRDAAAR